MFTLVKIHGIEMGWMDGKWVVSGWVKWMNPWVGRWIVRMMDRWMSRWMEEGKGYWQDVGWISG